MTAPSVQGRFHHAAVVVSSLDASIAFYLDCFGGEVELLLRDVEGKETGELHGLGEAQFDLAYINYGGARVELFEFHRPRAQGGARPKANEIGASHIAFEVDDVEAAYDELNARGVAFSRPPLTIADGDAAGYVLAFCADPDGNRIELISTSSTAAAPAAPAKIIRLSVREDRQQDFIALVGRVTEEARQESGNEQYALHRAEGSPVDFWLYERYRDTAAADAHLQRPAMKELLERLEPLLAASPEIIELSTVETA